MSKRFQPLKEFGRTTKKPKLDVSINQSSASSAGIPGRVGVSLSLNRLHGAPGKPSPVRSPDNFWGDDDDDVILLATQEAESHVAMTTKVITNNVVMESEISYSEFAPEKHATTSTQRPTSSMGLGRPSADNYMPKFETLDVMFADDDEDFEQLAIKEVDRQSGAKQGDTFKKPTGPPVASGVAKQPKDKENLVDMATVEELMQDFSQPLSQRRQATSERKIKFLIDRVDALKKENSKLVKDLTEAKTKLQIKDGETSLLRDELRHLRSQAHSLKMEKINATEATKIECKKKLEELTRTIEAKQTELQMKSAEYTMLKMQRENDSMRFEMSMRQNESCNMLTDNNAQDSPARGSTSKLASQRKNCPSPEDYKKLQKLLNAEIITTTQLMESVHRRSPLEVNKSVYEQSQERGTSKRQRTLFQIELENLQTLLAQVQLCLQQEESTGSWASSIIANVIASVCKVFTEFWSYVHSLEFPKHCRILPYHEYDLSDDQSEKTREHLYQPQELYEEERALTIRRYVATLALVCQQKPNLTKALLAHKHGEYFLMQIAIDGINKLGHSREVCEHFGLLEAFAALLHCMVSSLRKDISEELLEGIIEQEQKEVVSGNDLELLFSLLKHIAFTRPSPWIFKYLSASLEEFMNLPNALDWLCCNSPADSFFTDRVRTLYRFANDSCFLQVYCGLLEVAFPLYSNLTDKQFELLLAICLNHIRFAYYCFENPPKFIHDMLPCYGDSDVDDEEEEGSGQGDVNMNEATVPNKELTGAANNNNFTESSTSTNSSNVTNNDVQRRPNKDDSPKQCECYHKLCLSVVTLLYQALRQWQRQSKKSKNTAVAKLSKIGVQLLHIIFCDYYLTSLFRESGETTKHYLYLICEWWAENAELLQFNDIHKNFLRKLRISHIMPKSLKDEENLSNLSNDLAEWCRLTNDETLISVAPVKVDPKDILTIANDPSKFLNSLKGYAYDFQ